MTDLETRILTLEARMNRLARATGQAAALAGRALQEGNKQPEPSGGVNVFVSVSPFLITTASSAASTVSTVWTPSSNGRGTQKVWNGSSWDDGPTGITLLNLNEKGLKSSSTGNGWVLCGQDMNGSWWILVPSKCTDLV